MKKFAFISRHVPTPSQIALAGRHDIELVHVGDRDGFTVDPAEFAGKFAGAVVVHATAAMRLLATGMPVGVFENINRAPAGQPPQFEAGKLVICATTGAERFDINTIPLA